MLIAPTTTYQSNASGKISFNNIFIPFQQFKTSEVQINGIPDESGFFNFTISLDDGNVLHTWWRQNGDLLHVVLQAQVDAWLAIGWLNSAPSSTSGIAIITNANILVGSNESVRDDTGYAGGLTTDLVNNFISSIAFYNQSATDFEFLFPLDSNDSVDQPLQIGGYGFFTFAVGLNSNIDSGHGGSKGAFYLPNVYIETSNKEGFKNPITTPFTDLPTIFIALTVSGLGIIFLRIRR